MKKINPEDGGGLSNKKKGEPGKSLEDKEQQTENSTRGEKKETLSKEVSSFLTRDLQRKFFLFFFSHQYQTQKHNSAPRASQVKGNIRKMPSGTRQIEETRSQGKRHSSVEQRLDLKSKTWGEQTAQLRCPHNLESERCFLSNTVFFFFLSQAFA